MRPHRASAPAAEKVLTKALLRAVSLLGLSQQDLAGIVHVSPATVSRWASGASALQPESAEGHLGRLFLRVFRSLDALVGGEPAKAAAWLRAHNHHLGQPPLERLRTPEGLVHVADHLDALRGKA